MSARAWSADPGIPGSSSRRTRRPAAERPAEKRASWRGLWGVRAWGQVFLRGTGMTNDFRRLLNRTALRLIAHVSNQERPHRLAQIAERHNPWRDVADGAFE